jgi:glutamyl-tRNA reductase
MNLLSISISHNTAPLDIREALFLSEKEIGELINSLKKNLFSEGFVLSTCNRTEIYGIPLHKDISSNHIRNSVLDFKPVKNIRPEHFNNYYSYDAIEHLLKIISGIDSQLIGDNQIFSQVKDSFQLAEESGFVGFLMKRIFDSAVKTGKRAITETTVFEGAVSISYAAVQLMEKIFSNLIKKSALVIGAGETGTIAAKHLREKGIQKLAITNRTAKRAEDVAASLNAETIPFNEFKGHLHKFDIIIGAASSGGLILTKDEIKEVMQKRNNSDLVLMDIAVPRDFDPGSKEIDYVFYNDIESLNIIVEQNLAKRKEEIPKVEKIIAEELNTFENWYKSLEAAPTIKVLREYFEAVRAEEVEKNKNRFSPEDQEKLDVITKRIINKILHNPTIELKKINGNANGFDENALKIGLIKELFGLDMKDNNHE